MIPNVNENIKKKRWDAVIVILIMAVAPILWNKIGDTESKNAILIAKKDSTIAAMTISHNLEMAAKDKACDDKLMSKELQFVEERDRWLNDIRSGVITFVPVAKKLKKQIIINSNELRSIPAKKIK